MKKLIFVLFLAGCGDVAPRDACINGCILAHKNETGAEVDKAALLGCSLFEDVSTSSTCTDLANAGLLTCTAVCEAALSEE